jgi:hypothetical protein
MRPLSISIYIKFRASHITFEADHYYIYLNYRIIKEVALVDEILALLPPIFKP